MATLNTKTLDKRYKLSPEEFDQRAGDRRTGHGRRNLNVLFAVGVASVVGAAGVIAGVDRAQEGTELNNVRMELAAINAHNPSVKIAPDTTMFGIASAVARSLEEDIDATEVQDILVANTEVNMRETGQLDADEHIDPYNLAPGTPIEVPASSGLGQPSDE